MPTRDEAWPPGTPNWIDLAVADPAAAAAFYGELFGWKAMDTSEEGGGYVLAQLNDKAVAGIGNLPAPDAPANWSTYFATDDADATAKKIVAAGGTLHMDPFDVMDSGRMFFATAPDGATFGVWQATGFIGAGIFNEHGSYSWNELHSNDLEAARAFYTAVFGFDYDDVTDPEFTYFIFKRAGEETGVGGMATQGMAPAGTPSSWLTWFTVDDTEDATARVADLGGTVLMSPEVTPFGHISIVTGAQGEMFGLINNADTDGESPPAG